MKIFIFDMKVQGKLERKPFYKKKSHQKWFTKIWPIVETLAKTRNL